jgi:hypothetical protein
VNRISRIAAVLVLALWAACQVRCELEMMFRVATSCCDESGDKPSPAPGQHCVCTLLHSGGFISEKSGVSLPFPIALAVCAVSPQAHKVVVPPPPLELIFVPPELLKGWQFFQRAAAPPRAPSLLS